MKSVMICIFFALCACALADEGHNILEEINPHEHTEPPPEPHKFDNLKANKNPDEFLNTLAALEAKLDGFKQQIQNIKVKKRLDLTKANAKKNLDLLTALKPKLQECKDDLQKLDEISVEIKKYIGHNKYTAIRNKIVALKTESKHSLEHLMELIDIFNCKFMRKCLDNDIHAAKQEFLAKIVSIKAAEGNCIKFSKQCANNFKTLRVELELFSSETVEGLKKQLSAIVDNQCIQIDKVREELSKHILKLDTETKGWILEIQHKLKKLVQKELHHIELKFQDDCDKLNLLKISAKDNEDNVVELRKIINEMKVVLSSSEASTNMFLDVYELILYLKDVLDDELFQECYEKASSLYYLITGFKMQIDECIKDVEKRILVVNYKTRFDVKKATFINFKHQYVEQLKILKKMPQAETCYNSAALVASFETFEGEFKSCKLEMAALRVQLDKDLIACPEYSGFSTELNELKDDVYKYCEFNEHQLCFVQIFDETFCHSYP